MNIALLTGRAGLGSAFPNKNVHPVNGRPLMEYSVRAAQASRLIDDIYLSTDGERLKEVALECGIKIIDRPAELAQPTSQHIECIEHALHELAERKVHVKILIVLLCNVGIHPKGSIDKCINALTEDLSLDSAVTVREWGEHHPTRARKPDSEGLLVPILSVSPELASTRQLLETTYYIDGQVWAIQTRGGQLPPKGSAPFPFLGRRVYAVKNRDIVIDVHNEDDIQYTELWLRANDVRVSGNREY
jgi:CMP-N,N'-diacetyllegionaminic acid synthase